MRFLLLSGILVDLISCGTIPSDLLTGVDAKDRAEIGLAASRLTNSPITHWEPYPDVTKPTEVRFRTKDGRSYRAQKIRGKWHIEDITGVVWIT